MNLGGTRNPAWTLNLQANPRAEISLGNTTIDVTARLATGEDRERLWSRWLEVQPSAAKFRDLADREIPLFVLEPVEVS